MGGQKGVALFYQYLSGHHTIVMAASADNITGLPEDIIVYPFLYANKKTALNIVHIKELKSICRRHHIDCIIAEHSYTGWLAYMLKKQTGIPFIIHSHNLECYRFRHMHRWWWRLYGYYEKWVHQKADHHFFISEDDKEKAITAFALTPSNCSVVTYGVEEKKNIPNAAQQLRSILALTNEVILLFNGTLDYKPNIEAVHYIVHHINPIIKKHIPNYKIIITGNRITTALQRLINSAPNVLYKGYVDNINPYYQGADLFINPVVNTSGVKTKVIEALANNCTTISTASGAAGIPAYLCAQKLITVTDRDWATFANAISTQLKEPKQPTSPDFREYYNWHNIAAKASAIIQHMVTK